MAWVAVAAAAVTVGGSLLAGDQQASAAQSAADTSANATNRATDVQKQMYDQTRADQTPWRDAGVNALSKLSSGMPDWQKDPGYQFRLNEGQKAIDRSAAARGGLQSGAALKAATRYGQDYASGEYGQSWNRLASLAGIGQTANAALGAAGANYANNISNLGMTNAANQGNAALMAGNANASSYQGIGNALGRINWSGFGGGGGGSSWGNNQAIF